MTQIETKDLVIGSDVIYDGNHAWVSNIVGDRALICMEREGDFRLVYTKDLTLLP